MTPGSAEAIEKAAVHFQAKLNNVCDTGACIGTKLGIRIRRRSARRRPMRLPKRNCSFQGRHFFFVAPDWRPVTGTMMAALGGLRGFVGERR